MTIHLLLLALSFATFLLAVFEVPSRINLIALGLAFYIGSLLF